MASIYELSRDYQELSLMIEMAETEEELHTNVHNKIRNAIELGGSLYAVK